MPGYVDVHAHMPRASLGMSPQTHWPFVTNLAFGVTTLHDPSADTKMVFAESEMVKAGLLLGPRMFSTGRILYGADGNFKAKIDSYEDAVSHLRRLKAFGAFSVKSYNQPRRDQRQQVIKAGFDLGPLISSCDDGSIAAHSEEAAARTEARRSRSPRIVANLCLWPPLGPSTTLETLWCCHTKFAVDH